jgi:hypothetical protein
MIGSAINNLGNWCSFRRKDLLLGPLLLSFKSGLMGVFLRIRSVGLPIPLPVLLRSSCKPEFINLCFEGEDLLLFFSGGTPFSSEVQVLYLFSAASMREARLMLLATSSSYASFLHL